MASGGGLPALPSAAQLRVLAAATLATSTAAVVVLLNCPSIVFYLIRKSRSCPKLADGSLLEPWCTPTLPFGAALQMVRMNPAEYVKRVLEVAKRQGGVVLHFLTVTPTIVFADNDEAAKDIMSARITIQGSIRTVGKMLPVWDRLFSKGLFMVSPVDWKRTHRIAMRGFGPKQIAGFVPLVERTIEEHFQRLEVAIARGVPDSQLGLEAVSDGVAEVNGGAFFKDMAMRVILAVAFGTNMGEEDAATLLRSLTIFESISDNPKFLFRTYLDSPFSAPRKVRSAIRDMHAVAHRVIDRCKTESASTHAKDGTLLGALLHARDDEGTGLSEEDVVHNVYAFIVAGISTTSHMLTTLAFLLAIHEEVQRKLHAEVKGAAGWDALKDSTYLGAVITEGVRLWPSVISIPIRSLTEESTIGGIRFPKGARVGLSSFAMQRRASVWGPDVDAFRPERFLEVQADGRAQNPMMPALLPAGVPETALSAFGGGVRPCIGRPLAMVEMKLALARMLQGYSIGMDPGTDLSLILRPPFLYPQPSLRLLLRPRAGSNGKVA